MVALLLLFVKTIFGFIDRMVAFVIQYLYQLIIAIADTNVFADTIYHYLGRIYTFLGIFMVFKLSISMINYIINPDALTDKSKGFGKLIGNVIISLVLLVATPTLFSVAFDIQADILNTNALYQIVTGRKIQTSTNTNGSQQDILYSNAKINAETIAYGVYSAFIYDETVEISKDIYGSDGKAVKVNCEPGENDCSSAGQCPYGKINCLLADGTVTHDNNRYWWLLSTVVGVAVAYILLGFCLDVAVRSVKLGFLQIIAPIPIMMRMDPGAKDDKFSKWLKEVGSTFLSLFIRLAGLFFVIEIINLVMDGGTMQPYSDPNGQIGGGGLTGLFVKLFIIIGCLMFAKKLPQLISDLFGIKLDGDGFSIKKKMGNIPGLGAAKVVGAGALGFAGGMAANTWAGVKGWDKNKGVLSNLNKLGNSMTAGGFSGAFRGATSKEKNMFKAASAGISGAAAARNLRADRLAAGDGGIKGYVRRTGVAAQNLAGIPSGASKFDKQLSTLDKYKGFKKQLKDLSDFDTRDVSRESFMGSTANVDLLNAATKGTKGLKQYYEDLQNSGTATQSQITEARTAYEKSQEWAITTGNDQINAVKEEAARFVRENSDVLSGPQYSTNADASYQDINDGFIAASNESVKIKSSAEYNQAQINKKNDAKK